MVDELAKAVDAGARAAALRAATAAAPPLAPRAYLAFFFCFVKNTEKHLPLCRRVSVCLRH